MTSKFSIGDMFYVLSTHDESMQAVSVGDVVVVTEIDQSGEIITLLAKDTRVDVPANGLVQMELLKL